MDVFHYLQQKRYEASLAKAGTESDHNVLDAARLDSETPIKPRKRLAYLMAIIFGMLVPIILIFLRDFANIHLVLTLRLEPI